MTTPTSLPSRLFTRRSIPVARITVQLVVACVVVVAVAMTASPAWSHARVVASDPADGEQLISAPGSVTFTFSEDVTTSLGGIRVLNSDAARVDLGASTQPSPTQVTTVLEPDLARGTYLASYRVVSADGHVINGAITFAVGEQVDPEAVASLDETSSPGIRVVTVVGNVVLYGGVLLAIGLALLGLVVVDQERDRRRLLPWLRAAVAVGVVGAVLTVVAMAADATGRSIGAITDDGVLGGVLRQGGTGWWLIGLFVGLAGVVAGTSLPPGALRQLVVTYGVLVTAGSFALTGHTSVAAPIPLVIVVTTVHLVVAAIWLGGLVGLSLLLPRRTTAEAADPDPDGPDDVQVWASQLTRFSTLAVAAVALLWVSGVVQAWWTVGGWANLAGSGYGRILVVKLGLVVVTMALAAWNRWRLVPALTSADDQQRTIVRSMRWEVAILVAVIAVTSVLVDTPPGDERSGATPFSETIAVSADLDVNLLVTPGQVGINDLHITYIDTLGLLDDRVESVTVEMTLPEAGIGPLVSNAVLLEGGHYLLTTKQLTVAGTWELEVVSRIGTFDQQRTMFRVPIGK